MPQFPDHRDPFDHRLVSQAIAEAMVFVTADGRIGRYAIEILTCGA